MRYIHHPKAKNLSDQGTFPFGIEYWAERLKAIMAGLSSDILCLKHPPPGHVAPYLSISGHFLLWSA